MKGIVRELGILFILLLVMGNYVGWLFDMVPFESAIMGIVFSATMLLVLRTDGSG